MAWQDRHYYRDQSGGTGSPLMWLLNGSLPLFTAFGIRVRAHASMVIVIALTLLFSGSPSGMGVWNAMTFSTCLFGVILLHEFGHCFAARSVGGHAEDILMWPLGGLAYCSAPKRPWPQFWTAAGGPLVNVVICVLTVGGLALLSIGGKNIPWNPLTRHFYLPDNSTVGYYLWFFFTLSWSLLLFNLLPIYPLDGGRLLQGLLWFKFGYFRATLVTCAVGMVGAALMTMWGIANFFSWYGQILMIIGINCFMTCYMTRLATKAAGPFEMDDDSTDYSAAYEIEPTRRKKLSRWSIRRASKRAQKLAAEEQKEQQRIDAILAKVSAHGMHSLTYWEKRTLKKATEHQRQRDMEIARRRD